MKRWNLDAEIMMLRGLGYHHDEIAKQLKIKRGAVQYMLKQLRKRAEDEGVDTVFFEMCSKLYLPKLLRFLK